MLLAVDVGNTQTVFGLYTGDTLGERFRIATETQRTGDELGALLDDFVDYDALDGICLSSTVPRLVREYELLAERWAKVPLLVIGPGVKTGIQIQYDDPREVGPDRVMNAVAAKERYGAPAIVVDFGTSTNFDASHRPATTSAACSPPASRSRWTRSSRAPPASSRWTTSSRRP